MTQLLTRRHKVRGQKHKNMCQQICIKWLHQHTDRYEHFCLWYVCVCVCLLNRASAQTARMISLVMN